MNLVKSVVESIVSKKQIKHAGGKGNVLRKMREKQNVIGIVDEDPHGSQPGEMKRYIREDARNTIELLKRKGDDTKKLIQLSPDIEGWLIYRAKQNRISPKDYGLPDNRQKMHSIPHIEKKPNFQRFVNKLIEAKDDEINTFRRWIREAIE